ncbi:MAG: hypothetical protein B7X11_00165, partial [Acidobacteria bacterium 37-65-4]
MTSGNLVPLFFPELLETPKIDAGATALSPWDTLVAWLPLPPCVVLVLASKPEPVAEGLRPKGYLPVPRGATPATSSGGREGPPTAAVLVVDHVDLEATRALLEEAWTTLPDSGSLVAICARTAAPGQVRDEVRLLLDECKFQFVEHREVTLAFGSGGGSENTSKAQDILVSLYRTRRDRFAIRGYRAGDEAAVLPMFAVSFGTPRSEEHWRWKYRGDPYGSLRITEVFDENGRLAAHYAGYPVRFVWPLQASGEITALQIGDTMTSKAVRATGFGQNSVLARTVDDFYERHCIGQTSFNYGFNTGHIRKLGERYLGYRYISPVTVWKRSLRLRRRLALRALVARAMGYRAGLVVTVSPEWDDLFSRVAPKYGLLVQRDARYLGWRYLACPDRVHTVVAVRRRGALVGWGVSAVRGQTVYLGDTLFDPATTAWALPMLLRALNHLFARADTVQGWFPAHPDWWLTH